MTIYENINRLISYGLQTSLISEADIIYIQNKLFDLLKVEEFGEDNSPFCPVPFFPSQIEPEELENILAELLDYASKNKVFNDTGIVSRDLFDTKIMGLLVPPPSVVRNHFNQLKLKNPKEATDWYYKFSCDTDYIRRYRIKKDMKWKTKTEYGDLDITINLSKPEKDPKSIAAALTMKQTSYPFCLLCKENEGYAGRLNHAARQNHRIIPIKLNGEDWFLQYSPYVYYNEHCIVFDSKHEPMKISKETFIRLIDFVKQFPHYTLGSNADLPIVGGSILTHNHFQGGSYCFPMENATLENKFRIKKYPKVKCGTLKWPMSVIRLISKSDKQITECAEYILEEWKSYNDEAAFIFSQTDGIQHNTITPIARKKNGFYELDLVLRNNITTEEHPLGVFHPHSELHHIKKENIGLIEVMGLAVLPSRLKKEIYDLEAALKEGRNIQDDAELSKHKNWIDEIKTKHEVLDSSALKEEIGIVFSRVLEDAGVYKRTPAGKDAFLRFLNKLNSKLY